MNLIDRPGTYRGRLTDYGVSETRNGYPQFVATLFALEYFNEESGEYMPWEPYEQEITAYLVLYTKDKNDTWKELMNAEQLKKALGWNGTDFESLANGDYKDTIVMFRVESHTYQDKTSLQVQWMDVADANPLRTLPKYDASKLKAMNTKFAGVLTSGAPTPAPAKASKPASPPKSGGKKGKKSTPKSGQKASLESASEPKPDAPSTATPPPVSPAPAAPAPSGSPSDVEPVTKQSAWEAVSEMKAKDVTDAKLAEVWIAEGAKIGKNEDEFTSDDWAAVQKAVLDQVSVF